MLKAVLASLALSALALGQSQAQAQAQAQADSLVGLEMTYFTTSDQLRASQLRAFYESSKMDPYWPYADQGARSYFVKANGLTLDSTADSTASSTDWDEGPARGLKLSSGVKFDQRGRYFLSAEVGADVVSEPLADSTSLYGTASLTGLVYSEDTYWLSLRLASELLYPRLLPLAGRLSRTRAQVVEPSLRWKLRSNLRLDGRMLWATLPEVESTQKRNQRLHTDLQLMWGLQTYPHWIWLGVAVEQLSHSEESPDYWSPDRFRALGLRLDSAFQASADWQVFAGGSLNRIQESREDWGSGYYLRTGLQQGRRDEWLIRIYYESSNSRQRGSSWSSHGLGLSAQF